MGFVSASVGFGSGLDVFGGQDLLRTSCLSLHGQFSPHLCKGSSQKCAAKPKFLFECENTHDGFLLLRSKMCLFALNSQIQE